MNKKNYESSIDLIKIIGCVLVVGLHTLRGNLGIINYIIIQIAIIAVPLFFVVNGYLLFQKDEISYVYALKKIGCLLRTCFLWESVHACVYYVYYRELRNFIQSFFYDFIQEGLFYHFWFFGALILIYAILPIIHKMKKNFMIYKVVLLGLGIVCMGVHVGQLIVRERYVLMVTQTFRVWIWLFYFMLGGWIAIQRNRFKLNKNINPIVKYAILTAGGICVIMWEYFIGKIFFDNIYMSEAYHGAAVTIIATVLVFILVGRTVLSPKLAIRVNHIGRLTMGVYIIHPFVLAVIQKIFSAVHKNAWLNLGFWISTCMMSFLVIYIMSKIPFLKKMIQL